MRCKLHKIEQLSGDKTSVYSVSLGNEKNTLFDLFLQEFRDLYKSEIIDILKRLKAIGKETGAREHYFLRKLSNTITQKIKEREITYSIDGLEFRGAFVFDI
ncbi:MAG: hypothetical protein C0593_02540 [Marinilabiliales bacterium]|nr:MAG: hypothetical protein C0593_02540 [Marinilabiliales bacterium]